MACIPWNQQPIRALSLIVFVPLADAAGSDFLHAVSEFSKSMGLEYRDNSSTFIVLEIKIERVR